MTMSFKRHIFWLLLIFAGLPAIALALFGYFLASSSPRFDAATEARVEHSYRDYITEHTNDQIRTALSLYGRDSSLPIGLVDLILVESNDSRIVVSNAPMVIEHLPALQTALDERDSGVVLSSDQYMQFLRRSTGTNSFLTGVVFLDSSYTALVNANLGQHAESVASERLKEQYTIFVGIALLVVLGLSVLLAYWWSKKIAVTLSEPLEQLSAAAEEIAEGRFGVEVEPIGDSELRELIDSFNQMSRQLSDLTSRLAQTERVAAWRQIARRFAHELKNPLQPILVSLYQLQQKLSGSDAEITTREPLRAVTEEIQHLTALAERFSNLAKMKPLEITDVDVVALSAATLDLYQSETDSGKLTYTSKLNTLEVEADPDALREAIHNLVKNALQATEADGSVEVTISHQDRWGCVMVSDSGTGMDAETLATATLPYYTTKRDGTGLGLAIIDRSIVEMGGQMTIESASGEGTTVTLRFKLSEEK